MQYLSYAFYRLEKKEYKAKLLRVSLTQTTVWTYSKPEALIQFCEINKNPIKVKKFMDPDSDNPII